MSKILYLPTRYYPAISGAEFYLQRMAEILTSRYKYCIDIFTSDGIDFKSLRDSKGKVIKSTNKYFSNVNKLNINRYSINYNDSINDKIKKIKNVPAYRTLDISDNSLKEYLKNGPYLYDLLEKFLNNQNLNYDLIHSTFYPYFNLIVSLILGKLTKKPTICTPFFHFSNPRYLNSDLLIVLKKFDKLIACTNLEKKKLISLLEIPKSSIVVIPMGVDYEKFNDSQKNNKGFYNFKQNFFKNNEKKYKMVLFCGYKNYEKGAISILKAIPFILEMYSKIYFVFIGPTTTAFNKELSKIRKMKNLRVINLTPDNLTGYYDKKKLAAFKETDLYVMPSRSDAFGISFLEAWASGKPVIGANIGATPEVIRNNIDGLLVEFDNPIDIAEKVIYLLKKKRVKKRLGSEGKKKVLENHKWETIAKKTNELYQKLILFNGIK
ncbi:MAG: glycosyltransferase family 4 protein [Promethearchaeota archaeon]